MSTALTSRLPRRARIAAHVLRAAPAAMMVIHGTYRVFDRGVGGFGEFLGSQGLPLGIAVAWLLTLVEIAGGLTLIAGRFIMPLCLWFACEHVVGILTVHVHEGWFVVGGGRNGAEYSVLLLTCFVANAFLQPALREMDGKDGTT